MLAIRAAEAGKKYTDSGIESGLEPARRVLAYLWGGTVAVRVQALLHEQGVTKDELQQQVGTGFGIRIATERVDETTARVARPQPERVGAHHDLGTVAVGQKRIAYGRRGRTRGVVRRPGRGDVDTQQDAVGDSGQQLLLVLEVPVQGAGLHPELGGESPHREVGQADAVEQVEGDIDDAIAIMSGRAHDPSIVNAVQVNTVQVHCLAPSQESS